jgi:hypothetical protein
LYAELYGNCVPYPTGVETYQANLTTARNAARSRFYANLAAIESKFQGLTFAGELRESLEMIRKPAKALREGVSHYLSAVKRRGRGLRKHAKRRVVADTWLEYSFGWRPFISDIDNAITSFYSSNSVKPLFEMARGVGRHRVATITPLSNVVTSNQTGALAISAEKRRIEIALVKYYGIYESRGNGCSNSHSYGFSPWEFVPTVWELIPYSFLVDYFTNIGDIVSSWSYRFLGYRWASELSYREISFHTAGELVRNIIVPPDPKSTWGGSAGHAERKIIAFIRTPNLVLEIPSLELQCPGFGSKWTNLAALATDLTLARKAIKD